MCMWKHALMITCNGYHCGLTVIRVFLGVWGGGLSVWRSVQVLQLPPTVQRHAHVGVSMDGSLFLQQTGEFRRMWPRLQGQP